MIYKISFLILTMIPLTMFQLNPYWHDGDAMGEWEVSNNLRRTSNHYGTYQHIARQMDAYGYATHVGKIYRGELRDPMLNMPNDWAYGKNSDFNREDVPGNCQRTMATWVRVL